MTAHTPATIRNKYARFLIRFQPGAAKDLPLVSPHAHALAAKRLSHISYDVVLQCFSTDPFLAAKLCGVANSIFFNLEHRQVLTLREALDRVGVEYAQKLILEAPPVPKGLTAKELVEYWAHCMTVSLAAGELAAAAACLGLAPEEAALLGLIHDIGYLVELHYNPQLLSDVLAHIRGHEPAPNNLTHATLGESLSSFWSLPNDVQHALKGHHEPARASTHRGRELAALVHIADEIALSGTFGESSDRLSMALLGLTQDAIHPISQHAARLHDELLRTSLVA